ncbi:helix-turn-helix domain-containing protein [Micromonospora sp. CPCC 206061]|uniref:helix-turn-helix domain-containing protein n=1 Tax=Micromonospora sp. CPCC 206061 TaxID=3122410 RepID=UPI002FEF5469
MPTKREKFDQSLRARWLGERMRELRDERGLTLKYVAAYIGVEFSTLARYERAEWPFRHDHVVALLDAYGVHLEAERERLIQLARDAWRVNRWEPDFQSAIEDPDFVDCLWLEERAERICSYATMAVPPLLCTPAYAKALFHAEHGYDGPAFKVEKWLALLAERQKVIRKRDPMTRIDVLIEEQILHRPVGGVTVLREQLEHLVRFCGREDLPVQVRVVPAHAAGHPGYLGGFTLFRMPTPYPPVAYVEHLGGRLYIESKGAELYGKTFDALAGLALPVTESVQVIDRIAGQFAAEDQRLKMGVAA